MSADPSLAVWRERWRGLSAHAPVAVSALLAMLIAADLARIALAFSASPRPMPAAAAAAPRARLDLQRIVAAHLFGAAPAPADPGHAPLTAADLKLSGTIATAEPRHGFAIIVSSGASRMYAVGDPVGGAALFSVYLDRVILDRNGTLETLFLPHTALAGAARVALAAARPRAPHGQFVDSLGRVVASDPGVLDRIMHAVDVHDDKTDKMRGFVVYPVASGEAMRILGLSAGDLLTSLNGTALDDLKRGLELLQAVRSDSSVTATVERQGQKLTVTLNVADAAEALKNEAPAGGEAAADRT
jgi:general secretion pathway protein C